MPYQLELTCPSCGGNQFRFDSEAKTYEDYIGSPCDRCGRKLTDEDVREQVEAFAAKKLEELLDGKGV